jgi:peptidylprolyl isomerase
MKRLLPLLLSYCLFASIAQGQTVVKFFTTMGNFYVEMSDSLTPITSGNFITLVEDGYYDGVIFHRVIDNFMIQGGDPTGTGSGGPGYTIQDEFDSTGTLSNIQKSISMANTGQPNSGGSQFFINLVNNTYLDFDKPPFDAKHPVFGMVIDSFDVVQAIGEVDVNASGRPLVPVVMDSLRVFQSSDTAAPTEPPLSIRSTRKETLKLRVFPNPMVASSVFTIDAPESGVGQIEIRDQSGRVVLQKSVNIRKGMNRFTGISSEIVELSSGAYFATLQHGAGITQAKFMVVR